MPMTWSVIWDIPIPNDKVVKANQPDIIIKNWDKNLFSLMHISILSD